MRRRTALTLTATLGLGLAGCDLLAAALNFDALNLLGIMPKAGFSQAASSDFGNVVFALGAEDNQGFSLAPPLYLLDFEDDNGEPIEVDEGEEIPGSDAGTFVLLVDGSSSMLTTDAARFRVEAAAQVASRIEECSDHWDQALLEFTTDAPGGKYQYSRMLADYGAPAQTIAERAEGLEAMGSTPLWDATHEVLAGMDEHADEHEAELMSLNEQQADGQEGGDSPAGEGTGELPGEEGGQPGEGEFPEDDPGVAIYGRSLVVISDGADTASWKDLDEVIQKAQRAGVSVHAIGLGPASDAETEFGAEPEAIADLRRLALETGGTYGYVSSANQLPTQADAIAKAVCGGYTQVTAHFAIPPASGERVNGRVNLIGTDFGVPFTFTAP
jgi:hypothetical protein